MSKDTSLIDSFPFPSYLDSNYIPSDEEMVQIKTFLIQPREQLEQMRTEMARLHAELSSVKSKYDNLYHQFNSCASLITLPRRVPDDVLEEIFYQSLPTDRNALLDIKAAPLIFTRICRQWRQVAFTTLVEDPHSYEQRPEKKDMLRATAASEWLKRSGNLPLHISFVAKNDRWLGLPIVDPYLSLIAPFSSRWKSLVLEGHSTSFSRIFALDAADLRSLELLIFDFNSTGYRNLPQELTTTWSDCGLLTAPSLRKLSIRRVATMHPKYLSVNWAQLTHLELGAPSGSLNNAMTMSMSTASEILRVSIHLVSCRIKIAEYADFAPIHSMQLPLLRHLSMDIEGYVLPFTEKLEVPGLREINLHVIENNVTGNSVNYKTCLAPLFRPQQGRIQKLVVDTQYLDQESFLEILRKCPQLISLAINGYERHTNLPRESPPITIDNEFLEIISSNNGEALCSLLEEFICDCPVAFSTTGIIEFIKRKQDGNIPKLAKLKKIAMRPDNIERDVLLSELEPYISQGLTCDIPELDIPELITRVKLLLCDELDNEDLR